MKKETKKIGGHSVNVKEEVRDGVKIGIIEGYIATWDLDRGDFYFKDQFVKGAFSESIKDFKRKKRMPRFKEMHNKTIGGWKFDSLKEDDTGLFGIGEINLNVENGIEAYSLAKQGVLTDLSIGFTAEEFEVDEILKIRTINKAIFWEGSIVDEPMNPNANITAVKTATPYQNLPLSHDTKSWDSTASIDRIRELTGSTETPSSTYKNAFFYYDSENSKNFDSYKLPYADVIDGKLTAVPKGIFSAAGALQGSRGGVNIPESYRDSIETNINKYYKKMGRESPFDGKYLIIDSISAKDLTLKEFESILRTGEVKFTREAIKKVISDIKCSSLRDAEGERRSDAEKEKAELNKNFDKIIKLMET